MRIFEVTTLVEDETKKMITERRYSDDSLEFWSTFELTLNDDKGRPIARQQFPFHIKASTRAQAFENFDAARAAAEPEAREQMASAFARHQRQQLSQTILSGAAAAVPALSNRLLGRANGRH